MHHERQDFGAVRSSALNHRASGACRARCSFAINLIDKRYLFSRRCGRAAACLNVAPFRFPRPRTRGKCQHEVLLVCHSARDVATNEHVIERVLLPAFDPSCRAYLTVPLRFFH